MSDTIRYGIIGTGMMGIEHIMNLNLLPNTEITAIAEPNETSCKWAKKTLKRPVEIYTDYRDLLKHAPVDVVIIATPNYTHADVLKDVFKTDKAVLCEKPLCTTLEDCLDVVNTVVQRDTLFWVGMEYRYMPPVTRFLDLVHGGKAGRLQMFSIREHRFPFLKKVDDWNRFNRNTGGTLVEKSCHYFDMMRHVIQAEPISVFASGAMDVNHLDERYDGETPDIIDNAFVLIEFDNGVRAMHDLCMFAEASRNQEEMVAVGELGKLECLIPTGNVVIGERQSKSVETEHVSVSEIAMKAGFHHGATYYQHLAFQKALQSGMPPSVSALDGLKAVAMGMAAQQAIAEKRVVDMSEFGL